MNAPTKNETDASEEVALSPACLELLQHLCAKATLPKEFPSDRSELLAAEFAILTPEDFAQTELDPAGFQAPTGTALAAIAPGDFIKLALDFAPDRTPGWIESGWFQIDAIEEGKLVALVIKAFADPAGPIKSGEFLMIPPRYVLRIVTVGELGVVPGLVETLNDCILLELRAMS